MIIGSKQCLYASMHCAIASYTMIHYNVQYAVSLNDHALRYNIIHYATLWS